MVLWSWNILTGSGRLEELMHRERRGINPFAYCVGALPLPPEQEQLEASRLLQRIS